MRALTERDTLDDYFGQVKNVILEKQDWITGLLPASTAVNAHGNYTDAWVRDNVYSILAAWGLGLAYRKAGDKTGRAYLLEQSTVKLMRGLLMAMMRQAPKVEKFKQSQNPGDALHAKYDTRTGGCVVGDYEWGHLQLDATSLFLLMLAQMTASGLRIVFTIDEVNFVQNLVHYVSRTYRIPDYGIWERGHKANHGIAELNASSVGMAKAALEALSGFNLFGKDGGQAAVIHVVSDDIARSRITLESLLPRESLSKETDAALLSITGFPAFAIDNEATRNRTEASVIEKLEGRYGCKRFLLDGHQTALEDNGRPYYEPHELKQFQDIECEWPLFFTYLLLNQLFKGDGQTAAVYRIKLDNLRVEKNGQQLLPELYYVPHDSIDFEKAKPRSQHRVPNENLPLVWAQSLYILGCLIQDGLLSVDDIDPLGRYKAIKKKAKTVQIALLAQDESVQDCLLSEGIDSQTLPEIVPIQVREAIELAAAYTQVGRNDKIGFTGRPLRQLRTLATSKIYVLSGEKLIFLPQCLSQKGFYLALDNRLLMQRLRLEIAYTYQHWDLAGDPLVVIPVKQNMVERQDREYLIEFLKSLQNGQISGVPVKLGSLSYFAEVAGFEKIDYLHDFRFSEASWDEAGRPFNAVLPEGENDAQPVEPQYLAELEITGDDALFEVLGSDTNLHAQFEVLNLLCARHGLDFKTGFSGSDGTTATVRDLLDEIYERAGNRHCWYVLRKCAGLLGKYDINLEQAATEILVRQHALSVGFIYSGKSTLARPADSSEILHIIRAYNSTDGNEQIIIQEIILYLGMLIKSNPELFRDMHTVRVGHILQLIIAQQLREMNSDGFTYTIDQAFDAIMSLSPHQLSQKLLETMRAYGAPEFENMLLRTLQLKGKFRQLIKAVFPKTSDPSNRGGAGNWRQWRELRGAIGRESDTFFASMWTVLQRCQGVSIGNRFNAKRRLDSATLLSQMTAEEQSFKLYVSHLLNKIQSPIHRQLTVEALLAIATLFRDNESLKIDDTLSTDSLIEQAVKVAWLKANQDRKKDYEQEEAQAWQFFYHLPPHKCAGYFLDALVYQLGNSQQLTDIKQAEYDLGR